MHCRVERGVHHALRLRVTCFFGNCPGVADHDSRSTHHALPGEFIAEEFLRRSRRDRMNRIARIILTPSPMRNESQR